ncbi:DUF1127 domain-containing protein [Vannielia litorea]|uniref:Uncharacterized conserved protein YjiS, DUF1127 family n=1 Tax=Vannielia litorea TaxID=1217970 RepID=A0A1N6DVZ2_9RHOB|nr:DUF1127 domain-containing protein [Vannielia litorea]SIN74931.1 Uncharacterized conserved protein YjiS, DUF1127 family [Vannielia litorea]
MAYFDPTTRASGSTLAGRITRFLTRPTAIIAEWNDRRVTRNALSKLTDRELDDIGLCRSDLEAL